MKSLIKKISESASRSFTRVKTLLYYNVIRHADDSLRDMSLRECYEAAIFPSTDKRTIIQNVLEEGYIASYRRN